MCVDLLAKVAAKQRDHQKKRLEFIFQQIQNAGHVTMGDTALVMAEARQMLERSGAYDPFLVLNLYCNLCVHVKLEKSPVAHKSLQYVSAGLVDATTTGNPSAFDLLLSEFPNRLCPELVRQQLVVLYEREGITADMWKDRAQSLVTGLHGGA